LFCCEQEGSVNHEAMKIITKDLAGTTKETKTKTKQKKRRWLTSDQKPSPPDQRAGHR
jgi:hypothetical protein